MAYAPTQGMTPGGHPAYQLPADLFEALQIRTKGGKLLTAATARPSGMLIPREFNDLMSMAQMQSGMLSPELMAKYDINNWTPFNLEQGLASVAPGANPAEGQFGTTFSSPGIFGTTQGLSGMTYGY